MNPRSWFSVLNLILWVAPHILLGWLVVGVWRRRLRHAYPMFFAYVAYETVAFAALFPLYWMGSVGFQRYTYAYCATLAASIVLRFGVIAEVSESLFCQSRTLRPAARRFLIGTASVLLVVCVFLAAFVGPVTEGQWYAGVFSLNWESAIVQCGLLLALLLVAHFFGLVWRPQAFGIALGLGILTSSDVAMFSLRAAVTSESAWKLLNVVAMGAYFISVAIWMGYLLSPAAQNAAAPALDENEISSALPRNDEVETWNLQLRHFLRD